MPLARLHRFSFTHQRWIGGLTDPSCRRQGTSMALFKHFCLTWVNSTWERPHTDINPCFPTLHSISHLSSNSCDVWVLWWNLEKMHFLGKTTCTVTGYRLLFYSEIQHWMLQIVLWVILHNKVLLLVIWLDQSKRGHFYMFLVSSQFSSSYTEQPVYTRLELQTYNRLFTTEPVHVDQSMLIVLPVCSSDEPANPGETSRQWRQRRWDVVKNS